MIDIKLKNLDEKREVKWENCMRVINQSLENKLIYNVDFKNLNQDLSRVIEYGYGKLLDVFCEAGKRACISTDCWDFLYYSRVESVASVRSFNNKLKKTNENIPTEFIEYAHNLMPLVDIMKELKGYIVKGRKPSDKPNKTVINPDKITMTCPCCGREIAVGKDGTMVNHGFHRPGYGWIVGNCIGVGQKPLEVSDEGLKYLLNALNIHLLALTERKNLALKIGEIDSKNIYGKTVVYKSTQFQYNREIEKLTYDIKYVEHQIESCQKSISEWKPNLEAIEKLKNR
jgi:hypothetical protein